MRDEDDSEEETRVNLEARRLARNGAGRRLRLDLLVFGTLTFAILWLSAIDRGYTVTNRELDGTGSAKGTASTRHQPYASDSRTEQAVSTGQPVSMAQPAISWHPPLTPKRVFRVLILEYGFSAGLADVAALALIRVVFVAVVLLMVTTSETCRTRVTTTRFVLCAFESLFLTAKAVAHLPDLRDSAVAHFIFWTCWCVAFVCSFWEWRLVDDALARADEMKMSSTQGSGHRSSGGSDSSNTVLDCSLLDVEDGEHGGTKKQKNKGALRSLLKLSLPDAPLLAVAFVFLVMYAISAASVPHFTGLLIDAVAIDRNRSAFSAYAKYLLLAAVCSGVFAGARGSIFTVQMARLNARVRQRLFDSLLTQNGGFFDEHKTGDLSSRLNNDCSTIANLLSLNINVASRNFVNALGVIVFMLLLSWPLTLVTLFSLPPTLLVSKIYGEYFRKVSKKTQKALADATAVAEETLSQIFTVKAFAGEPFCSFDFYDKLQEFQKQNRKEASYVVTYTFCLTTTPMLVTVLVLWYGGMLVLAGSLNPGALVSFMLYQQQLTSCFSAVADVFTAITTALGAAEKVLELIDQPPDFNTWPSSKDRENARLKRTGNSATSVGAGNDVEEPLLLTAGDDCHENDVSVPVLRPQKCDGLISLTNVTFAYPTRLDKVILKNINITVKPGETVAFVGPSGGGKSSIVNLIQRFYEPQSGVVSLDGTPIGKLDPLWYKKHVSIVAQEPCLFHRSVRRNIVFGLEKGTRYGCNGDSDGTVSTRGQRTADRRTGKHATRKNHGSSSGGTVFDGSLTDLLDEDEPEPCLQAVVDAAISANAHEFIARLPETYETNVGERGSTISGGQKQRLAIARALVRNPTVLLLDEATSALDAESEFVVQEALERVVNGVEVGRMDGLSVTQEKQNSKKRTALIIAHRLSTIQSASRIVFIENGAVAESGTHDELLRKPNGKYAGLVRRQMEGMKGSVETLVALG